MRWCCNSELVKCSWLLNACTQTRQVALLTMHRAIASWFVALLALYSHCTTADIVTANQVARWQAQSAIAGSDGSSQRPAPCKMPQQLLFHRACIFMV